MGKHKPRISPLEAEMRISAALARSRHAAISLADCLTRATAEWEIKRNESDCYDSVTQAIQFMISLGSEVDTLAEIVDLPTEEPQS